MNKRGQELVSWEFVKGVILIILIMVLLAWAYRGVPDSRINKIKAEDLSLSVSSVFIVDDDLNFIYDLGEEYYVDIDKDRVKLYQFGEGERWADNLFLDEGYNFAEQVEGKRSVVNIMKEGNRLVIS